MRSLLTRLHPATRAGRALAAARSSTRAAARAAPALVEIVGFAAVVAGITDYAGWWLGAIVGGAIAIAVAERWEG